MLTSLQQSMCPAYMCTILRPALKPKHRWVSRQECMSDMKINALSEVRDFSARTRFLGRCAMLLLATLCGLKIAPATASLKLANVDNAQP